ncbi:MAG TPA: TonB-dependent receptor [Gemmatimonadales bacterium]
MKTIQSPIQHVLRRCVAPFTLTALAPLTLPAQERRDSLPPDSAYVMPELVVTATRSERVRRAESAVTTSVARPTLAERADSRVAADLLRAMPGVHVQQTSAGQGAVVLRGFVGNQVLLLVNGIPLNNGSYRDGPGQYLATVDPETIERIEVVRGPASVLYGSDAQGGVINLITRPHPGLDGWTFRGTASGSTANNGFRSRLSTGYLAPGISFGLGATVQDAGDLRAGGRIGRQTPTSFSARGIDARLSVEAGPAHRLTLGLEHYEMHDVARYDRYVEFRAPRPGPDAEHVFDPQTRQLAFARHRVTTAGQWLMTLETTASLAVQREGRRQQRLGDAGPATTVERTRDDVFTPGLSVLGTSFVHVGDRLVALAWGGEAYRDQMASHGDAYHLITGQRTPLTRTASGGSVASGRFPDGATMVRTGLFLSGDAQVAQRLRLSAGGRLSGFRSEANIGTEFGGAVTNVATAVTGQLGAVFSVAAPLAFSMRVAQGFRAPNLYDLTNVGTVPGGILVPNPNARPERSVSYEASLRWTQEMTALEVTGFRSDIDDFIDRAPGTFRGDTLFQGERVFQGRNLATASVMGVEAEGIRSRGPFDLRVTMAYTRGEQTLADGTVEPMAKIPPLSGAARLRWRPLRHNVWLAYELAWAGRQSRLSGRDLRDSRIPAGGTRGYGIHSFLAYAQITPAMAASVGIKNVANDLYRTHASGVDAPGRHVWMGISLQDGR